MREDSKDVRDNRFACALSDLECRWALARDKEANYFFDVPDVTVGDYFDDWVRCRPDAPFIIDDNDVVHTYGEVDEFSNRLANAMLADGFTKGDRVITYLGNRIELVIIAIACFKIGAVIVASNPREKASEVRYKVADSGARFAFVDVDSLVITKDAIELAEMHATRLVLCDGCEFPGEDAEGVMSFARYLDGAPSHRPIIKVLADDLQALQYTGGTTGVSKGCCVTNRNFVAKALSSVEFFKLPHGQAERSFVLALPLSHGYGFSEIFVGTIIVGSWIAFTPPRPTLEDMLSVIERHRPTCWPCVPTILNMLAAHKDYLERYDFSSLRSVISAAAPLPVATIEAIESATNTRITEGYGLTEAGTGVTGVPFRVWAPGTTGIPLPNMNVLIVDLETGEEPVPIGTKGEIIVNGVQVCDGYWNKPEETAKTFRDGWLYTGDVGAFDERGMLTITGRIKEMIIVSGFNVYPRQVDEIVMQHPGVTESCTIGVPDPKRGEVPVTFVVMGAGASATEESLRTYVANRLVRYKVPRRVVFVDEIPKTKAGKSDRQALAVRYDELLDEIR